MSHHIYTTKAFITHSSFHGEAGRFLLLFTEDFGMIGAFAQGIRLAKSKLRFHTQDFSFIISSLVKGKEMWRLTGAHEIVNVDKAKDSIKSNILIKQDILHIKILKLLKRLLHGEEKNKKLFNIIETLYRSEIEEQDYDNVECLTVLRILNSLGYIKEKDFSEFLYDNSFAEEIIDKIKDNKKRIISAINA